jgi:hypothetical protein
MVAAPHGRTSRAVCTSPITIHRSSLVFSAAGTLVLANETAFAVRADGLLLTAFHVVKG